jgi:hypothetical protein
METGSTDNLLLKDDDFLAKMQFMPDEKISFDNKDGMFSNWKQYDLMLEGKHKSELKELVGNVVDLNI